MTLRLLVGGVSTYNHFCDCKVFLVLCCPVFGQCFLWTISIPEHPCIFTVTSDRIKRRIKQTRELAKLLQSENTNLSVSEKLELKTGLKNLEKLVNQKPGTHVPAERFQAGISLIIGLFLSRFI